MIESDSMADTGRPVFGARVKLVATVGLALLAVLGNVFNLPLFFGVSFIFGSIAVMLAVALLGLVPALVVAIAGGLYTLMLWGHPYALVIFTLEALTVGLLHRRGMRNLVLADLSYWLVLGAPLVLIFYRGLIGMGWEPAVLIALKQPLNGLFNALLAGLLVLGLQLWPRIAQRLKMAPVQLTGLLFHVLLTAILLAGAVPIIHEAYSERQLQEGFMAERLNEQAQYLSERLQAQGLEDKAHWQAQLKEAQSNPGMSLALLSADGQVLARQGEVASVGGRAGDLQQLGNGLAIWLPSGDIPTMPRWKQGHYRVSVQPNPGMGVAQILVEQEAAPLVRALERKGQTSFLFLTALLLLGILAARSLSRWLTLPLRGLEAASRQLSKQIADGLRPSLPVGRIQEYASLGHTLQDMVKHLADSIHALRQAQTGLEEQVRQRTAELDRSVSLLGNVLAAASELSVIATDTKGVITIFNSGAERLLGYPAQDLVGKQTAAIFHLRDEIEARGKQLSAECGREIRGFQVFAEIPEREGAEMREWTYVRRDGRHVPVSLVVTTMRDDAGAVTGYLGIGQDISERRQAETALREQAQHMQAILDNMVDGIIVIDKIGTIDSFNPAAERIFGYTSDEAVGRNVRMLMPNPHRDAHDSYLRNYHATGVARIIGIGREVEGQRKDGSLFAMDLAISEISRDGRPWYVGMVRDITERKRVERMKSEFVSTVSHELRTPLTSISGALGLIAGGALGAVSPQAGQMLAIAHKNSLRLAHLINDLLDMEKIAAGKLLFDMQVQLLLPLVDQALEANRAYGLERRVALTRKDEAGELKVRVDSQRFAQILSNLLSNAVKFSHEDATVETKVVLDGNSVRITVTDHGPGIPAAFRTQIFQKFAQADSSDTRQKGGTGLGLAITRELVERMGGTIGFESVEGEGASFFFELPVWTGQTGTETKAQAPSHDMPHILVVEDEPDVAQLLSLMLVRAGYAVDIALSGAEALQAVKRKRYDAMTLDLVLPDINGLDVIRRIRQDSSNEDLPIIVVSGKMEEGRLAINGDFTAIDWLAKPIDEKRLLSSVEKSLPRDLTERPRVLHVEDDADLHQVVRNIVGDSFDFELASTLGEARARVALERFDVVILDLVLPDGSGWDLLPEIRACQPEARVVILTGTEISADEVGKVESVLLKTRVSPRQLLDAISARIRSAAIKGNAS